MASPVAEDHGEHVDLGAINMTGVHEWKLLLDTPAHAPELGFGEASRALADVVLHTPPRFAVGIFGGWGSGKTTLMKAIARDLSHQPSVVCVDFNAWRYEREAQLLIPLLDCVRGALLEWAKGVQTRSNARNAAIRIGRVARALLAGVSAKVEIPGVASVGYDVDKAMSLLAAGGQAEPQSLYVAAFDELRQAYEEFRSGGVERVVIFVDDLDRCLPSHALDVLESMKLFFDIEGFVFVVGLDEGVIERAVWERLATPLDASGDPGAAALGPIQRLSREYVRKIFQVPYLLPPVVPGLLRPLLDSIVAEGDFLEDQRTDVLQNVAPHLKQLTENGRINPREVKRFINTYTLQRKVRPGLRPDVIVVLQTIGFRSDWRLLYDLLVAEPELFLDALERFRNGDESAFAAEDESIRIDVILGAYLRSAAFAPLLEETGRLPEYVAHLAETTAAPASAGMTRLRVSARRFRYAVDSVQEWFRTQPDATEPPSFPSLRQTQVEVSDSFAHVVQDASPYSPRGSLSNPFAKTNPFSKTNPYAGSNAGSAAPIGPMISGPTSLGDAVVRVESAVSAFESGMSHPRRQSEEAVALVQGLVDSADALLEQIRIATAMLI